MRRRYFNLARSSGPSNLANIARDDILRARRLMPQCVLGFFNGGRFITCWNQVMSKSVDQQMLEAFGGALPMFSQSQLPASASAAAAPATAMEEDKTVEEPNKRKQDEPRAKWQRSEEKGGYGKGRSWDRGSQNKNWWEKDKFHQDSDLMGLVQSMGRLVLRQEDGVASLSGQDSVRPGFAESLPGFRLADGSRAYGVVLPTVGSGEEGSYDPERSNSLSGEEVSRGYRAIETVDGTPQCLSSVSCHETAGREVSVRGSGLLADLEPEAGGSQRGYGNPGQDVRVFSQPYNRIANPSREATEAALGIAAGADAIHKIVLRNAGNYCYANSCMRSMLWLLHVFQEPRDVGGSLAALFKLLLKAAVENISCPPRFCSLAGLILSGNTTSLNSSIMSL